MRKLKTLVRGGCTPLVERVLEDLLFQTGQTAPETVTIDREFVESRLTELSQDEDLSQYIL
jgi:ATP-dependent protease HslVU (ClpYQ) ATPase subunit